ncbi:TetR/AcrR family transcriptional regulator [Legionella israelensis]|uniref:TetR/AcrR family transcriptional regulator n=1 Tax=Legionella israelensis TaxID=454 RepID=UPI00117D4974|nr:TetR/AcrR family transcriptional regulator [Legionella israelensis]QDP71378.1 TetR/AcrR family transcriptional regulator [Legionella israelensis]
MNTSNTKERILTEAESLIQRKGYNAFSFKDIANAVNIKTASIHYHFPSKEDLGVEVIAWHIEKISKALLEISHDSSLSARQKLHALLDAVFLMTYNNERKMCLGGMFASDTQSLPISIQNKARKFFEVILDWIQQILKNSGYDTASSILFARQILSLIEGSLLLARLYGDKNFLEGVRGFIDGSIK